MILRISQKLNAKIKAGKLGETPLGTVLYFSSEDELRDLFEPCFEVTTLKTIQVEGKQEPHLMNCGFMKKQ